MTQHEVPSVLFAEEDSLLEQGTRQGREGDIKKKEEEEEEYREIE